MNCITEKSHDKTTWNPTVIRGTVDWISGILAKLNACACYLLISEVHIRTLKDSFRYQMSFGNLECVAIPELEIWNVLLFQNWKFGMCCYSRTGNLERVAIPELEIWNVLLLSISWKFKKLLTYQELFRQLNLLLIFLSFVNTFWPVHSSVLFKYIIQKQKKQPYNIS